MSTTDPVRQALECARIKLSRYQEQHPDTYVGGVLVEYEAVIRLIDQALSTPTTGEVDAGQFAAGWIACREAARAKAETRREEYRDACEGRLDQMSIQTALARLWAASQIEADILSLEPPHPPSDQVGGE